MPTYYSQPVDPTAQSPSAIAADLRAHLTAAERQLRAIPAKTAAQPLAPGKWSTQQTVGHLIDSCANNLQRLIRLQLTPELTFPGYQPADVAVDVLGPTDGCCPGPIQVVEKTVTLTKQ